MRTLNKRIGPFCIKNVAKVKVLPISNPNYQLLTGNTGIGNISTLATFTPAYSAICTRKENEAGERRAAFDLAKRCLRAVLNDKVDFVSIRITIVVYLRMAATIGYSLEIFHDNHRLEQFSAKRMGGELGAVGYADPFYPL